MVINYKKNLVWVLFSLAFFTTNVRSFSPPQTVAAQPAERVISDADWAKAKAGIDYTATAEDRAKAAAEKRKAEAAKARAAKKKTSTPPPSSPFSLPFFQGMSILGKTIFMGLIVLLVGFLLYYLAGSTLFLKNKKVTTTESIRIEDVENDLQESDLERFLRQSLEQSDYRLALRIHYLMILKALSQKEWIAWKKEKTNYEYCRELREKTTIYASFRDITGVFERVWYGANSVNKAEYERLQPLFKSVLSLI